MGSSRCAALLLGFFLSPCCSAQGLVTGTTNGSQVLQPWLIGLTAVVCLLFIIFVANLINRAVCSKKKTNEEDTWTTDAREHSNFYDNIAMEGEEQPSNAAEKKIEDEKLTSM